MIILIDMDGVLADIKGRQLDIFHAEHPEVPRVPSSEIIRFETEENYPSEYRETIDSILLRAGFFSELLPIDGAIEAVYSIMSLGREVRICTAPKRQAMPCVGEKYDWILRHFGQDILERMIVTRDKTLVKGNILIDDKPEIKGIATPEWEHVLFDCTYNRHMNDKRRLTWSNYREVLGL